MRKILFRGKRISGGEWAQGGIAPAYHAAEDPMEPETQEGYSILADGRAYAVDQDSIGQYTGLSDQYGAPIFEDDLVIAHHFDGEGIIRGRVRFGRHAGNMSQMHVSQGFYIEWAADEFLRKELGFWRERISVIGPWADQPETWDRWIEEAGRLEREKGS